MSCEACIRDLEHYHIKVVNGKVTQVSYMSASGYWDYGLDKDEWIVEYVEE